MFGKLKKDMDRFAAMVRGCTHFWVWHPVSEAYASGYFSLSQGKLNGNTKHGVVIELHSRDGVHDTTGAYRTEVPLKQVPPHPEDLAWKEVWALPAPTGNPIPPRIPDKYAGPYKTGKVPSVP